MESATKVLPQPGSPYRTQNECSGRIPSISQFGFGSAANSAGDRSLNLGSDRLSAVPCILIVPADDSSSVTTQWKGLVLFRWALRAKPSAYLALRLGQFENSDHCPSVSIDA